MHLLFLNALVNLTLVVSCFLFIICSQGMGDYLSVQLIYFVLAQLSCTPGCSPTNPTAPITAAPSAEPTNEPTPVYLRV